MSDSYLTDMIVEIPYNSNVKYEMEENNVLRCDRILNTSMMYPGNYGYIPNTLSGDGDPLDILLLTSYPILSGVIIKVKIIGVLNTTDESGTDEKILCVPCEKVDLKYKDVNSINDIPKITLDKVAHFFTHYKDNDKNKWVIVGNFGDKDDALKVLNQAKKQISKL